MEVQVEVHDVYGKPTVYPVGVTATLFAQIAGTKTLSHDTLCRIEALGYTIVSVPRNIRNVGI